jgi:uncharacterized protein (DUF2062 family)
MLQLLSAIRHLVSAGAAVRSVLSALPFLAAALSLAIVVAVYQRSSETRLLAII